MATPIEPSTSAWQMPQFPRTMHYLHNTKLDVPLFLVERLKYQYALVTTSKILPVVHEMSRALLRTCVTDQIALPEEISQAFCYSCQCFQVPGVSCHFRLQSRTKKSSVNHHKKLRLKNELVSQCLVCNYSRRTHKGCNIEDKPTAKSNVNSGASSNRFNALTSSNDATKKEASSSKPHQASANTVSAPQKGFSFRTALQTSNSASASNGPSGPLASNSGVGGDFISLSAYSTSKQSQNNRPHSINNHHHHNNSYNQMAKKRPLNAITPSTAAAPTLEGGSLLDAVERAKKKEAQLAKRRKSA